MSTKELILEEALKQFSEKGFAGTSMRAPGPSVPFTGVETSSPK